MNDPLNVIPLKRIGHAKYWNIFRRYYPIWDDKFSESQRKLSLTSGGPKLLRTTMSQSEYGELIKAYEKDEDTQVFLCLIEETPIGYVLCKKAMGYVDNVWFISELYIDSKYRGHGYGREALTFAELHFRSVGVKYVMLRVHEYNKVAKTLYTTQKYSADTTVMYKKL